MSYVVRKISFMSSFSSFSFVVMSNKWERERGGRKSRTLENLSHSHLLRNSIWYLSFLCCLNINFLYGWMCWCCNITKVHRERREFFQIYRGYLTSMMSNVCGRWFIPVGITELLSFILLFPPWRRLRILLFYDIFSCYFRTGNTFK